MATRRAPRALWRPATGGTPGTAIGATFTSGGTVTTPAIATTSFRTQRRRTNFATSGATPAGLTAGDALTMTAVSGGGLAFYAEFALATNLANTRLFVGLSAQASVCTNNPSSATNLNTIGVGFDASDATGSGLYFISRGNAGGASNWKIPLGTGAPASKVGGYASRANGDVYGLFIHAGPNAATRGYLVVLANLTNQAIVFWHVVTTNIPIDTSLLRMCAQVQGTGAQLDLYSLDLDTSFDGIFDIRDFGAVGDGAADDFGAIQAALFAASGAYTTGDSPVGGSVVRVPPGRYRCSRPINLLGAIRLEGAQASGGEGGSTLVFDADVGEGSIGDPALGGCLTIENTFSFPFPARAAGTAYVAGDIVVPPAVNGYYYRCIVGGTTAAGVVVWATSGVFGGATVTDGTVTWLCCGLVPSANGAIVRNLGLLQAPGGSRVGLCHGVMVRTVAHLENLFIQGFTGDGIHIYGNNVAFPYSVCNGWSISGATQVSQCKRNGVFVAGQDANSGTMSGPFQAIDCDAFGLWNNDRTGNCYQSVGGEGCGVYVNPLDGHWNTAGGIDIDSEKWAPLANYSTVGARVLPTVNKKSGYQYVVTQVGLSGPVEPVWPTVIGTSVGAAPEPVFTCWMHEGGTVRTDDGGICSFGHIHGEEEK
ncbi:MAG: hypothetical protein JNL38_13350, partial [Myxococcales bacterium]|nr:hypothetical protein [Myxococcales bacterium]